MVLIRLKYAEEDMREIRRATEYRRRTICYSLGESARDTLKQWQEQGLYSYIEDEYSGIILEERQTKLTKLGLNELMDRFFFQDKRFCSWQIFPENRTKAMTDLEGVVVRTLETIPTAKEIKAGKSAKLTQVYQKGTGIYLLSQHTFKKHGKKYTTNINVDVEGEEIGKFFLVGDHPGSGSPTLYFDRRIIYNNAPEGANAYVVGGIKVISRGKELEPSFSCTGKTTRQFIWSPICANTKLSPVNPPEHTKNCDGYCIVPIKYLSVDEKTFAE